MKNFLRKTFLLLAMPMAVTLFSASDDPCPEKDDPNYTVIFGDPADCTAFFVCSNGVAIKMHCPDGLHFNDELDVCEWPQDAKCGPESAFADVKEHLYICKVYITAETNGELTVHQKFDFIGGTACTYGRWNCKPYNPCLDEENR